MDLHLISNDPTDAEREAVHAALDHTGADHTGADHTAGDGAAGGSRYGLSVAARPSAPNVTCCWEPCTRW